MMLGETWKNLRRYADALTHMGVRQLAHRPRRLLPARVLALGIRPGAPENWRPLASGLGADPAPNSGPLAPSHLDRVFRGVGCERDFGVPGFWTDRRDGLLFLFHLHGFTDLAAYAAGPSCREGDDHWEAVIADWLLRCRDPSLLAWHPYPLSGRIVAWCAALSGDGAFEELRPAMLSSLTAQAHFLRRSVEHEIGGNHVLRNATALAVAGVCLEDTSSLRRALRLLEREVATQVLADGGHEERSPSYHRIVLGDLIDARTVLTRAGVALPSGLDSAIERMQRWLALVAGPGGDIPPLNDGWDGPPIDSAGGEALTNLSATGYTVLRDGGAQALFDAGAVAPPHLPAHAHADTLSLLMWAEGERLIVDCGSAAYAGPDRRHFRSTAAHNTVEVDGQDQCDLWAPFRAAFMPNVQPASITRPGGAVVVRSSHDGYRRLSDPVVHERTLVWMGQDGAVVVDRIRCARSHRVTSRLHFAEAVLDPLEALPGGLALAALPSGPAARSTSGFRSPYLGCKIPVSVAECDGEVRPDEPFGWSIVREGVEVSVDGLTVVIKPIEGSPVRLTA